MILKFFYFLALCVLWLLLSGHYEYFVLTLGLLSVILVTVLSLRMGIFDREAFPAHLLPRALGYWLWLIKEILKANIDVARRIISPSMPIEPVESVVEHDLVTDLGRSSFANSITLTPGTVSTGVDENGIRVHALSKSALDDLKGGEMLRRVRRFEKRN